ncbi:MAG: LPS-assembly protein LptD [Paludibacteraceae bacterium]|nr:LPS-assembly protein LptD [Paludibacteraceae bacterium]
MKQSLHIVLSMVLVWCATTTVMAQSNMDVLPDTTATNVTATDSTGQTSTTLAFPSSKTDLRKQKLMRKADNSQRSRIPVKKKRNPGAVETDIIYSAKDSIVMEGTTTAILYGDAYVKYENIELKANYIRLRLDSSTIYATGTIDSTGEMKGKPVFSDGGESYESEAMQYNVKSKKGLIWGTVTQQGEGYITSGRTKKISEDEFCLKNGKYTTCDQHEHPHYYFALTKAKLKKDHYVVSGPAYLVVEDIPLPLAVPFGYFPTNEKYASGILMPTFGEEATKGFYAKDFGYYFAINDYVDLALTADVYSKGSWGVDLASSYKWRYKFNGSFNLSYIQNVMGEKYTPDYSKSSDFSLRWSHNQDPKMNPFTTFSASVNFATSSYERNNVNSYYNPNLLSQNTKSSTITLTQKFPDSPFTLSTSMYVNQRTADSTINLQLPSLTLSMTRVYPFKRKMRVGKEKWYEKISMSYSMNLGNSVTSKESELLHTKYLRDWKVGVKHDLPISASFTLFKYLNLTASLNNSLKWYFQKIDQSYDEAKAAVVRDTSYGFYNIYTGSASLSMQTQLFGFYTLKSKSGRNMPVFRHKMTPSASFSIAPDYGAPGWGYWGMYERMGNDGAYHEVWYDRFSHGIYSGSPSRGASGVVSFSLANDLEMKYWSRRDTTNTAKKVTIIDNLSVSSGYNIMADSLNWSNIAVNLRLKFVKQLSLNIDMTFDPYTYEYNELGTVTRVNRSQLEKNGILGRLMSTGTSFGYTFSNSTFKKKTVEEQKKQEDNRSQLEKDIESLDPTKRITSRPKEEEAAYQKFEMPWSLTASYSIRYGYDYSSFNDEIMEYDRKLTHNLTLSGYIDLTNSWHFTASAYYDITNNKWNYVNCTLSKDLHCWQMSASFVPVGLYKTYDFLIGIKSTLLQDLKYEKKSETSGTVEWF